MDHKQVMEMLEWLQKLWTDNDRLKPIEYYTLSARTKHTTFSTSFSQESQERVVQAIDHAITCVGAIEQIKWERDIAIKQLNELGYQFGEKEHTAEWKITTTDNEIWYNCSHCGEVTYNPMERYCRQCGYKMKDKECDNDKD